MGQTDLLNATVDGEIEKDTVKDSGAAHAATTMVNKNELKKKYGRLFEITITVDEDDENEGRKLAFLFTQPTAASFNRYVKTASKNMVSASENFARDNIIEEQVTELEKECDAYPGLVLNIGQRLLSVLGLGDNVNFKRI